MHQLELSRQNESRKRDEKWEWRNRQTNSILKIEDKNR